MVAAALIKSGNNTYISMVSDSEVTGPDTRFYGVINTSKVIQIGSAVLSVCGTGPMAEAISDVKEEGAWKAIDLSTMKGIRELAELVWQRMKELIDRSMTTADIWKDCGELLIGVPNGIYKICTDLSCFQFQEFACIGSGSDIFNGAYTALLETKEVLTHDDLDSILKKAVEITNRHSILCGGETHLIRIPYEFPSKRGRPKQ